MLKILYCRNSLCAGDDANRSIYTLILPNDTTIDDLIYAMRHKGCGNEWPMPSGNWIIRSNIGDLAKIEEEGKIEYLLMDSTSLVMKSGIEWVYGDWENSGIEMLGEAGEFARHR